MLNVESKTLKEPQCSIFFISNMGLKSTAPLPSQGYYLDQIEKGVWVINLEFSLSSTHTISNH